MSSSGPSPTRNPAKPSAVRNLLRLIYVAWVLLPEYRALRRSVRREANEEAPTRLAGRLTALGPAFVKLGQMLSTRPELLPQAYVDALSRLQENGPEVPGEAIRAAIENQLGKPVDVLFAAFRNVSTTLIQPVEIFKLASVHMSPPCPVPGAFPPVRRA